MDTERRPYEKRTGELRWRKVAVPGVYPLRGVLEERWIVQDGEPYPVRWNENPRSETDVLVRRGWLDYYPWYVSVRDDWRPVPTVYV